jgi:hypothetical protein
MLLDHFAASQSLPNIAIRYGRLEPQPTAGAALARPGRAGGPERVHADLGELGATATAVLLACVRADGAAAATGAPQLWCKVSVEHPGGDKDKVVLMASSVGSLSNGACRCLATWARADFGSDVY